jgi:hypothetical protein
MTDKAVDVDVERKQWLSMVGRRDADEESEPCPPCPGKSASGVPVP